MRPWIGALALVVLSPCGALRAQEPPARGDWQARYEQARADLVRGRYAEAAAEFEALAATAPSDADRVLAREFAALAESAVEQRAEQERAALRSSDELGVLYATAVFYGLGTSGWLALQIQPESFGAALLPFAVLTPAAVGVVALADSYRPLRRGIPHSIAAGLYLGFGEALWVVGYQHAYATYHDETPFEAEQLSTVLWAGSTIGAGVGGLIGALSEPTPGRVSFTASTAIWVGLLSAFTAAAIEPEQRQRAQASYLVGGIGYNAGLIAGIALGRAISPSVARVRFVDLGALFGGLIGAGGYALFTQDFGTRGSFATTAIASAIGLGFAWWATAGMPGEGGRRGAPRSTPSGGADGLGLRPVLLPAPGGLTAGVAGEL